MNYRKTTRQTEANRIKIIAYIWDSISRRRKSHTIASTPSRISREQQDQRVGVTLSSLTYFPNDLRSMFIAVFRCCSGLLLFCGKMVKSTFLGTSIFHSLSPDFCFFVPFTCLYFWVSLFIIEKDGGRAALSRHFVLDDKSEATRSLIAIIDNLILWWSDWGVCV